jgi:hypothetical protein
MNGGESGQSQSQGFSARECLPPRPRALRWQLLTFFFRSGQRHVPAGAHFAGLRVVAAQAVPLPRPGRRRPGKTKETTQQETTATAGAAIPVAVGGLHAARLRPVPATGGADCSQDQRRGHLRLRAQLPRARAGVLAQDFVRHGYVTPRPAEEKPECYPNRSRLSRVLSYPPRLSCGECRKQHVRSWALLIAAAAVVPRRLFVVHSQVRGASALPVRPTGGGHLQRTGT